MITTIQLIITIFPFVMAIYYLYQRTGSFINNPEKMFNIIKKNYNKTITIPVKIQENDLVLTVFPSVLLGEKNILVSLVNKTALFRKDLILNLDVFNKGYNSINKEFLIVSKNIKQPDANIDVDLDIWITGNECIRYEIRDATPPQ